MMNQSTATAQTRTLQEPSSFLSGLARAAEHPGTTVLALPACVAPLEVVLECFREDPFCLFGGAQGVGVVGIGAVESITLSGKDRCADLRVWLEQLANELHVEWAATGPCPPPRLLGGISFAPDCSGGEPWSSFPDGYFVLPRWSYVVEAGRAYLYLAVTQAEARDARTQMRMLADHVTLTSQLEAHTGRPRHVTSEPIEAEIKQLPYALWKDQVEGIREVIRAGTARKIVSARVAELALSASIEPHEVLMRMAVEQTSGTRFGVRIDQASFVGTTPETLFHKSGNLFVTHALAGTLVEPDSGPSTLARPPLPLSSLLESEKDGAEHAYVADEIRARMQPLCTTLISDATPRVRRVRRLVHLETHFSGVLSGRTDATELLSVLHPTPAIGGTPTDVAVEWIKHNEAAPRGWYAGAVGWLDLRGDGHFSVAIRSGVIAGRRAYAFAGAGIVDSSDPLAEYGETHAKQEPFLSALGLALVPPLEGPATASADARKHELAAELGVAATS